MEVISKPGYDALWADFGLSYASFLVMPRVLMHEMPDEWQGKMAELLAEWHDSWNWPDEIGSSVVCHRIDGKFSPWPRWVLNYRRPAVDYISTMKRNP
jgi:hypothetical protein